jgi:predicted dehydrogenase
MHQQIIKLGIIGFGGMGALHAEQLRHIENVAVVAVVEPGISNLTNAEEFYSGEKVAFFRDVKSALENAQVDGWIVSSDTKTHIPITRILLENGCTVLLEKPLSRTLVEAEEIGSLVKPDSTNLMVGNILLWSREFQSLKNEVTKLGNIKAINISRQRSENHRVRYPDESPFALTMVHDLYTIYSLLSGEIPTRFSAQRRNHDLGGVDLVQAQLEWKGNLFASLQANYLIPDDISGGGNIDEFSVAGQSWLLRLLYDSGFLWIASEGKIRQVEIDLPKQEGVKNYFDDALRSELQHFVLLIRGAATVPLGARYEDACHIQSWIDNLISLAEERDTK